MSAVPDRTSHGKQRELGHGAQETALPAGHPETLPE